MSMSKARDAVAKLVESCGDGTIDALCERLGIRIMGIFGSAAREGPTDPRDVDIAVGFDGPPKELALIDALTALTKYERFDIAIVDHAEPLLRANALVGIPLYERESGQYATEQMYALAERRDTDWMRELDLKTMAAATEPLTP